MRNDPGENLSIQIFYIILSIYNEQSVFSLYRYFHIISLISSDGRNQSRHCKFCPISSDHSEIPAGSSFLIWSQSWSFWPQSSCRKHNFSPGVSPDLSLGASGRTSNCSFSPSSGAESCSSSSSGASGLPGTETETQSESASSSSSLPSSASPGNVLLLSA